MTEQFTHLRNSGLYDRMDTIYCSFIGEKNRTSDFLTIGGGKCKIVFTSTDPTVFEYPTLIFLSEFTKQKKERFAGFYFHTKGASWISKPEIYNVGNSWRLMAEYFMFDCWRLAVASLAKGYSVYGTNYQECLGDKFRLIGGNFWWFDSEYVKTLETLKTDHNNRTPTETWILSKTHNAYCPFEFTGNIRYDAIPQELYLPNTLKMERFRQKIRIYFSRYSYLIKKLLGGSMPHNPILKSGC